MWTRPDHTEPGLELRTRTNRGSYLNWFSLKSFRRIKGSKQRFKGSWISFYYSGTGTRSTSRSSACVCVCVWSNRTTSSDVMDPDSWQQQVTCVWMCVSDSCFQLLLTESDSWATTHTHTHTPSLTCNCSGLTAAAVFMFSPSCWKLELGSS